MMSLWIKPTLAVIGAVLICTVWKLPGAIILAVAIIVLLVLAHKFPTEVEIPELDWGWGWETAQYGSIIAGLVAIQVQWQNQGVTGLCAAVTLAMLIIYWLDGR
jgi:hypothetical protein